MVFKIQKAFYDSDIIKAVDEVPEPREDGKTHFITTWSHAEHGDDVYCNVYITSEEAQPVLEFFDVRFKKDLMSVRYTKWGKALQKDLATFAKMRLSAKGREAARRANPISVLPTRMPTARKTLTEQMDAATAAAKIVSDGLNTLAAIIREVRL